MAGAQLTRGKGRGAKMQNADVGPSLHTLSDARLPIPVTPLDTCRFAACSKHGQVTHPLRGLARDVPPPADCSTNLWAHLTAGASHGASLIRPYPASWCKLRRGPQAPHRLYQSPSPHPWAVASLSPSPKLSIRHSLPLSEPGSRLAQRSP